MDSDQGLVGPFRSVERLLELCWRHVIEIAVQAVVVVPVDPAQGGQLDVLDGLPRPSLAGRAADKFGLVVAVDRLSECVVTKLLRGTGALAEDKTWSITMLHAHLLRLAPLRRARSGHPSPGEQPREAQNPDGRPEPSRLKRDR